MKKHHKDIIAILMEHNQPVSSTSLAKALGISSRTVKNYIHEINGSHNNKIILSTKTGYLINKETAKAALESITDTIPQNYEERSIYLIKQLLIGNEEELNIYDLCDSLFISYSTLKNDIGKMNRTFSSFNVKFDTKNDILNISGSEKAKRKLVSYILSEEVNGKFINIQLLKNSFSDKAITILTTTINNTFSSYNYYMNDFSYFNIILHLAIVIDRILTGNSVLHGKHTDIEESLEKTLVTSLCSQLELAFTIAFSKEEFFEIFMLFKTNANSYLYSQENYLEQIVDVELIEFAKEVLERVQETYFIDLSSDSFLTPFIIHLSNMISRIEIDSSIKNPMADNIKNSCPTIYDIAIFISIYLMNHYHMIINEDETAFIALHIGGEIERQEINSSKISCAVLCPNYGELSMQLYNQLLLDYGNQLNIVKVVSFVHELENLNIDLLITTIKLTGSANYETILVPPFSSSIDKSMMLDMIYKIRNGIKFRILKKHFRYYFHEELFQVNPKFSSKEQLITELSDKMYSLGYVDENFVTHALEREKVASTAFSKIAIPHSVRHEALKTNIAVVVSKQGIMWDTHVVYVVFLIAMNKPDSKTFRELYEALVILFNNESVIKLVRNCKSFSEFENIIYTSISLE